MRTGAAWVEVLHPPSGGKLAPKGKRRLGYARGQLDERTGDIHAEAPCPLAPWYAYGRFRIVDGQLQMAEIRLFPGPDRIGLSKESPDWPPIGAVISWVAADDFTTPVLRSFPTRLLRLVAIECVEDYGIGPLSAAEQESVSRRPGRAGKGDAYYARWAARYTQRADARAPIAELAREHGLRREQVRDLIQQARKRGLLSVGRRGLLTEKAKLILEAQEHGDDEK